MYMEKASSIRDRLPVSSSGSQMRFIISDDAAQTLQQLLRRARALGARHHGHAVLAHAHHAQQRVAPPAHRLRHAPALRALHRAAPEQGVRVDVLDHILIC